MKLEDIYTFEEGKYCFSQSLQVNGIDYEDMNESDIIDFIMEMFKDKRFKDELIKDTFINALYMLPSECIESDSSSCDSCGDWNQYSKWKIIK